MQLVILYQLEAMHFSDRYFIPPWCVIRVRVRLRVRYYYSISKEIHMSGCPLCVRERVRVSELSLSERNTAERTAHRGKNYSKLYKRRCLSLLGIFYRWKIHSPVYTINIYSSMLRYMNISENTLLSRVPVLMNIYANACINSNQHLILTRAPRTEANARLPAA